MAPATTSQPTSQSSPPQETSQPPKRTLRSRGSNAGMKENSSPTDGDMDTVKEGGGGGANKQLDSSDSSMIVVGGLGGGDARVNGVEHRKRKRSPSTTMAEQQKEKRVSALRSKETPEQTQLREFISQTYTVLSTRDSTPSVLHFPLPATQTEAPDTPNLKRSKTESSFDDTHTIASKMSNNEYTSISQLEDDLLTATQLVLQTVPVNTQPYTTVTSFFTFAQNLLLNKPSTDTKQIQHTLRSQSTNGTTNTSPQVPPSRPPLREALYTLGPNGPLFTSIASRDTNPLIAGKLPAALTLPTSTGGTFTASSAAIVPINMTSNPSTRKLADVSRPRATFGNRKRGDFSDDALSKLQATRWLDWGCHASFAPEWDDGGVGGGFGADGISLDWAYKRLRREKKPKEIKGDMKEEEIDGSEMQVDPPEEVIDENLILQWEGESDVVPLDLVAGESVVDEREMSVDETLHGLRTMIALLGQLQTLRIANGKFDVPEDEKALAENIVSTFQSLIITHSIPPKELISSLPEDAYNIITLTHPEYAGSLPTKTIPSWQPPLPTPPQPPPHNQRGITAYSQNRPLYTAGAQQLPPRSQPGTPIGGYRPQTTASISRPYQSGTPASTSGYTGVGTPGTPAYTPGHRPVGRPRKYAT